MKCHQRASRDKIQSQVHDEEGMAEAETDYMEDWDDCNVGYEMG